MISAKASKRDIIRAFGKNTLANIVAKKPDSIAKIARKNGVEVAEKYTAVMLADLSSSFGGDLTKDAVLELSAEISSTHLKALSLEDIMLVCEKLKRTEIYGKLKLNKVLVELDKHYDERAELFANRSRNEAAKYKFDAERIADAEKLKHHKARLMNKLNVI